MAPTDREVQWQTSQIIECLFEDDTDIANRSLVLDATLEHDGPEDDFDPVVIADRLRQVADSLNEDMKFKAALNELKKAAAQEAAEVAFSQGVDILCQTQVPQSAEVASELQLIKASVAFGLYVVKSSPDLKNKVQSAMNAFLNRRVQPWVTQQGGWNKVKISD